MKNLMTRKLLIAVLFCTTCLLSVVASVSAEPTVESITLYPENPWIQSIITFNVTITSDPPVDEAWLKVSECIIGLCYNDPINVSLTLIDSNKYQTTLTLKHDDTVYIDYQVFMKSNGIWYSYPTAQNAIKLNLSAKPTTNTITITSPNGGENWYPGTQYTIAWTTTGNINNVKIELSLNDVLTAIISDIPNNEGGNYQWTIPQNQTVSSNYKIKITDTTDSNINDYSDNYFTITTNNNGGEKSPGFELILVCIAVTMAVYMVKRKR